jgi:GNAT superfamily N-acetyltransferase
VNLEVVEARMQIRLATFDDVPALERLIEASVRALGAGYYSPLQIESSLKYVFGVDTQLIADGTYFVVEVDGQIAGCGGWSKRRTLYGGDKMKGAEDDLLDPQTEPSRIRAFFVHPDFARRGIGRMLLAACERAAGQAGFTALELAATLPGEPLYAACGFHVIERIEATLPDGVTVPIVRMGKSIAPPE